MPASAFTRPILVLGATGGFGLAVTRALIAAGARVRALVRDEARARRALGEDAPRVELRVGDALQAADVSRAAEGCSHLVHAINVPYPEWDTVMERVTTNVIAAARAQRATIVFAGNVYNLAPRYDVPLSEAHPEGPITHKGQLRMRMEHALRDATQTGDVRVLVVRANDYFGPTVRNGGVDPMFLNALARKPLLTLTDPSRAHEMAYVPDVARATVALMGLTDGPAFDVVHVRGFVTPTSRDFLEAVARVAGVPARVRRLPWWLIRLGGLFNGMAREVVEMRYLFENTLLLDDATLKRRVPDFTYTPLEQALRDTLESYRHHASRA
ncbi:NAD(P)H-binding protein [Myxococcaceae bacterium JPH2]|nr:NAD(P)H-binding protein [Myxococcaceae bacterium JPH2]